MADFGQVLRFLREAARGNLGLKLLALASAALLWWFVAGESRIQIGYRVPVEIRNLPERMAITNKVEHRVEVRLAGPSSLLGSIREKELVATIDLAEAKAGKQSVRLTERSFALPAGVRIQRIYPQHLEVVLEALERKTVPVVARIGGPAKLRKRIEETRVDPPEVEVEALPGDLQKIRSLHTEEIVPEVVRGSFRAKAQVELPVEHAKIVGTSTVLVTVRFAR